MGSAASVTAYLQVPAKRTVGVVRMTVGGMRIGVGGVRMAAGGMRIGVGACEWPPEGCESVSGRANGCRRMRIGVDVCERLSILKNRVVSGLRANQCWLGMRISVGTNANTHNSWPRVRKPSLTHNFNQVAACKGACSPCVALNDSQSSANDPPSMRNCNAEASAGSRLRYWQTSS